MQTFYIDCKSPLLYEDGKLRPTQLHLKKHQRAAGIIPMIAWKENIYCWSLEDKTLTTFGEAVNGSLSPEFKSERSFNE
jgi:hypothetical protein